MEKFPDAFEKIVQFCEMLSFVSYVRVSFLQNAI